MEFTINGDYGECDGPDQIHLSYVTGDTSSLQACKNDCDAIGDGCILINFEQGRMCELSGDVCPQCADGDSDLGFVDDCTQCSNYHTHGYLGPPVTLERNGNVRCYVAGIPCISF